MVDGVNGNIDNNVSFNGDARYEPKLPDNKIFKVLTLGLPEVYSRLLALKDPTTKPILGELQSPSNKFKSIRIEADQTHNRRLQLDTYIVGENLALDVDSLKESLKNYAIHIDRLRKNPNHIIASFKKIETPEEDTQEDIETPNKELEDSEVEFRLYHVHDGVVQIAQYGGASTYGASETYEAFQYGYQGITKITEATIKAILDQRHKNDPYGRKLVSFDRGLIVRPENIQTDIGKNS